ncbi:uncharacterized protein CBL_12712 [Carabus blaptoides fortunei]
MSLCLFRRIEKSKLNGVLVFLLNNYSRRSNNNDGPYKIVTPRKSIKDIANDAENNPNYELLALTKGFPFFMPGNVGPAWHDLYSTVHKSNLVIDEITKTNDGNVECQVQSCPRVLRQTVCELFPNRNLEQASLSVVTLTMRPDAKHMRLNKEVETEKMAQTFVLAAHGLCKKLHNAGYWADFINPFSGRPYLFPPTGDTALYVTDEKFRCLDFQIISIKDCKIITNEEDRQTGKRFVGSLFTNAPSKKAYLDPIFDQDD